MQVNDNFNPALVVVYRKALNLASSSFLKATDEECIIRCGKLLSFIDEFQQLCGEEFGDSLRECYDVTEWYWRMVKESKEFPVPLRYGILNVYNVVLSISLNYTYILN